MDVENKIINNKAQKYKNGLRTDLVSPKYFVVNVKFAIIFNLNNFAVVGIFAIATLNSEILKMGLVNHAISTIDKV